MATTSTTKGKIYPSESRVLTDRRTGTVVRQITSHRSIHHHPFFLVPAFDDAMHYLTFVSHRTGSAQIFVELQDTHELVQLTDRPDITEWSVYPSHSGRYVYFTAGTGAWRVSIATMREELLHDFRDTRPRGTGTVGPAMGTTALSMDDRWWAIRYNETGEACLSILDTISGNAEAILRRDSISHMQFCPDDPELLFYAGPLNDRVWTVRLDGTGNRRLYQRNAERNEWITHESWIPGRRELAMVSWPNGVIAVHIDTGSVRPVTSFNAWHAICNRTGTLMVADTNFPDTGIRIFDPRDGKGEPRTLCHPEASSIGEHWDGPFPYANGPIPVYAPQHTHPHPSFSPDGRRVVYTSDRSGFSEVYEVEIASN